MPGEKKITALINERFLTRNHNVGIRYVLARNGNSFAESETAINTTRRKRNYFVSFIIVC